MVLAVTLTDERLAGVVGVALLLTAIAAFVVEAHAPGLGVPSVFGTACLIAGAVFLYRSTLPTDIAVGLTVGSVAVIGALFTVGARLGLRAQSEPRAHRRPSELVGQEGIVTTAIAPTGVVRAGGESWTARSDVEIPTGAHVRVTGADGLTLEVVPIPIRRGSSS